MTTDEKLDRLELWATFAAEALQEICDEAQVAVGYPLAETERLDLRGLLRDLDNILIPEAIDYANAPAN